MGHNVMQEKNGIPNLSPAVSGPDMFSEQGFFGISSTVRI